jgi:hypothetical protein
MTLLPPRYLQLIGWTIVACVIAGMYGAIHDQLSFTISPDYFFAFKFEQFRIDPGWSPRMGAAIVGWMASWWTGLAVGPSLYLAASRATGGKVPTRVMLRGIAIVLLVLVLFGGLGLLLGLRLAGDPAWQIGLRPGVEDRVAFTRVGILHEASYLGGLAGTIIASVAVAIDCRRRTSSPSSSQPTAQPSSARSTQPADAG